MAKLFSKDFFHFCVLLSILSILLPKNFFSIQKLTLFVEIEMCAVVCLGCSEKKVFFILLFEKKSVILQSQNCVNFNRTKSN